jgi:hypothetical protein
MILAVRLFRHTSGVKVRVVDIDGNKQETLCVVDLTPVEATELAFNLLEAVRNCVKD